MELKVLVDVIKPYVVYVQAIAQVIKREIERYLALNRLYGSSGYIVALCGNSNVWRVEAKIIGELDDNQATEFRKSIQDECSMIAVAVSFISW